MPRRLQRPQPRYHSPQWSLSAAQECWSIHPHPLAAPSVPLAPWPLHGSPPMPALVLAARLNTSALKCQEAPLQLTFQQRLAPLLWGAPRMRQMLPHLEVKEGCKGRGTQSTAPLGRLALHRTPDFQHCSPRDPQGCCPGVAFLSGSGTRYGQSIPEQLLPSTDACVAVGATCMSNLAAAPRGNTEQGHRFDFPRAASLWSSH